MTISVSGISTWNWSLADDVAFYARAGIATVGLALRKLDPAGWRGQVDAVLAAGITVGNVIGAGALTPDSFDWAVAVARAAGAPVLVLTTGPAGDLPWEAAADRLELLLAPRLPDDVTIAIEHTHALRVDVGFVHTLRDAADLAARLGTSVCMEVNACWAERGVAATIERLVTAGRLALVQVSDFAIGTKSTPDRLVPGDGDIPLARLLGHVVAAGYTGAFDLELIGPRIEAEGYEAAIPRAIAALEDILAPVL